MIIRLDKVMILENNNYTDLFEKYFSFWDKLSNEQKDLLIRNASLVKYEVGRNIHSGENDCIGIFLVKSGMLRTYILSEDGREITLYRLYAGDVCILSASCVLQTITFDVFIDAGEETELLLINTTAFSKILEDNVYVQNFTYKLATERFSDVMWAMQQILFMSFDRRLAIFLNDELAKNGGDTICLTHEQIAKYVGSAREVVTRMLKHFSEEGIVELSRGGVKIIDKKKLKALL